jgi:hypothetical protein
VREENERVEHRIEIVDECREARRPLPEEFDEPEEPA